MSKDSISSKCKDAKCPEYLEWSFGYGPCYSCRLQGQSEDILNPADNPVCIFYGVSSITSNKDEGKIS